jgi:hypothetical protein
LTTGDTRSGPVSRLLAPGLGFQKIFPLELELEPSGFTFGSLWSRDQLLWLIWYPLEPESGLVKGGTGHRRELEWAPLTPERAPPAPETGVLSSLMCFLW